MSFLLLSSVLLQIVPSHSKSPIFGSQPLAPFRRIPKKEGTPFPIDIVVGMPQVEGSKERNPFKLTIAKSQPVFDVALEDVYWKHQLLPPDAFSIKYVDSNLSDAIGVQRIIDQYFSHTLDAVMGLPYAYALAPVARLSRYWFSGVPVFSTTSLMEELGNKEEFPLLTRMIGPYTILGNFVMKLMQELKWEHVFFLFSDPSAVGAGKGKGECYFALSPIKNRIRSQANMLFDVDFFYEDYVDPSEFVKFLMKGSFQSKRKSFTAFISHKVSHTPDFLSGHLKLSSRIMSVVVAEGKFSYLSEIL
jgi:atrial natriuretic peptide receptor A